MYQDLILRDNEDTVFECRWTDTDGVPYQITAAAAQVRLTQAAADPPLLAATVTFLGAPDYWVRFIVPRASILAADFDSLYDPDDPPFWDATLTRQLASLRLVPVHGRVQWNQGVSR